MEKQPNRLETLAALCEQKLLADPNHPRAKRLARDLATFRAAQRTGDRISRQDGANAPEGAEGKEDR